MMKIKTTSSGNPILQFNAAGSGGHDIYYNRSTNELTFKSAGGSDRLKIAANGDLLPAVDSQYNIGSNTVRFANIYADTLYGDGLNLTGITETTINNNANNRLITGSGTANTLEGEAGLTFDGNNFEVTATSGTIKINSTGPGIHFIDTNADSDYMIQADGGIFKLVEI